MGKVVPCQHEPHGSENDRHEREGDERRSPSSVPRGERHGHGGRQRRADLDAGGVDTGGTCRAHGKVLLHCDRHERAGEAHAGTHRPGEENDECCTRGDSSGESEHADEQKRPGDARPRPYSRAEIGGGGSKEPHAEDRDRPEQADDRVCRVQPVLDVRQQRADTDDLRPQRERDEEEAGQYRGRAHDPYLPIRGGGREIAALSTGMTGEAPTRQAIRRGRRCLRAPYDRSTRQLSHPELAGLLDPVAGARFEPVTSGSCIWQARRSGGKQHRTAPSRAGGSRAARFMPRATGPQHELGLDVASTLETTVVRGLESRVAKVGPCSVAVRAL